MSGFGPDAGLDQAGFSFGSGYDGMRIPNPDNPGGYITTMTTDGVPARKRREFWQSDRTMSEAVDEMAPLDLRRRYSHGIPLYVIVGQVPTGQGVERVWASVFVQEGRIVVERNRLGFDSVCSLNSHAEGSRTRFQMNLNNRYHWRCDEHRTD
jgi:hypothetical protein